MLELGRFGDRRFAKLAYGTSVNNRANQGYEVRVSRPEGVANAGLDKPTRFACARTILVSLDHSGFEPAEATGIPIIGRLDGALQQRMDSVRARLQAEADMAAVKREERRKERRVWRR